MRFSRLRLTGFKSFVDPTDLLIQDGLTGVVGPNGCGKSNLLEALRWVMGENRPTAMRGGGMEDVIFAGAASRPARNYAEVALSIDNSERVAPAGFNDTDQLDITRRITRDVGSAYRVNGKEVRARDVQMLFADASTGSHSPALVRQGQISELINAKPKSRRRVLEDAAGIAGLYQRRHEAELKLKNTEANLTRVDDVVEGLASQLSSLAKQARQAARYRAIGEDLRAAEGQLLYRRWRDADLARASARASLREAVNAAAQAERAAREAATLRESREEALPPLREEEAIAVALLQRITVERDALVAEEERARQEIETLKSQIARLVQDIEREGGLDRDAGETIRALEDEAQELAEAGDGHDARLAEASEAAREAASVLEDREAALSEQTEDLARLSARHQSAHRALADAKRTADRSSAEAEKAAAAAEETEARRAEAEEARDAAEEQAEAAREAATEAEEALTEAEAALADTQTREGEARAARSEAEGEVSALRAERDALARLLERDSSEGEQILDRLAGRPRLREGPRRRARRRPPRARGRRRRPVRLDRAARLRQRPVPSERRDAAHGSRRHPRRSPPPHVADRPRRRGRRRPPATRPEARPAARQRRGRPLALGRLPRARRGHALRRRAPARTDQPAGRPRDRDRRRRGQAGRRPRRPRGALRRSSPSSRAPTRPPGRPAARPTAASPRPPAPSAAPRPTATWPRASSKAPASP